MRDTLIQDYLAKKEQIEDSKAEMNTLKQKILETAKFQIGQKVHFDGILPYGRIVSPGDFHIFAVHLSTWGELKINYELTKLKKDGTMPKVRMQGYATVWEEGLTAVQDG